MKLDRYRVSIHYPRGNVAAAQYLFARTEQVRDLRNAAASFVQGAVEQLGG